MKHISFLIKPASSTCNMRCRYCFYADVAEHRETPNMASWMQQPIRQSSTALLGLETSQCASCPFERICHKNCKRLNTCYYREDYCGYRDFLEYAAPDMVAIARTLR